MESSASTIEFLEGKTILITGSTGFLAKILVERILHIQPNINKLFLLLREADNLSSRQCLNEEVIEKELFKVLREKLGAKFKSFVAEKLVPVPGDITCDNLGVRDSELRNEMWREIDIIVNSAATTNFYDRYDVALDANAFGAINVLNFAKNCSKRQLLIHLSTAYVCGHEKEGIILEKSFMMGETLHGASISYLDINAEKKLVDERLRELQARHATEKEVTSNLKDLGRQRASLHGWPNTYTFTKAMGEMLLGNLKDNVDVIVLRPTIITSTIKTPFPGWIEGIRTIDGFFIAYGKGKLKAMFGNGDLVIDAIPGDMVVDFIIAVMIIHVQDLPQPFIYHIGSSRRNPLTYADIYKCAFNYFTRYPCTRSNGKLVRVKKPKILKTMATFRKYYIVRLLPLVKILKFANVVCCHQLEDIHTKFKRNLYRVIRLGEVYESFVLFKGIFDDMNTEKLLMIIRENNTNDILSIDSKNIKWEEYLMYTHFPGMKRYLMK